jgi:hypothetical protein
MFSYLFCLMIEGSGSVYLTNGSGSGRPENIWILRIRLRNTVLTCILPCSQPVQSMKFLGDEETVRKAIESVMAQGKAK